MYDECGARVANYSGLVKSGCSKREAIWGFRTRITKCTVPDIPLTIVPEWFRRTLRIMDEPGTPIPEGRTPKMTRHVRQTDNDVDTVTGEADANMDDQENIAEVEVNNLINDVVTEVNLERTRWKVDGEIA